MQKCVTLSVTKPNLMAAVECVKDMLFILFIMRLLESIGLKVKNPMVLMMDNKGTIDLINSWGLSGNARHVAVEISFLRELKESDMIASAV